MPLRHADVDPLNPSRNQNRSMWISVNEGKNQDMDYVSRPCPADGSGIPTFKMPNTKAGQWYMSRCSKLPTVTLSKTQTSMAQRKYAASCNAEFEWADERQAQLNRLVELREKLRLEELELAKADAVTSLEAHLSGAFEANNSKAESSGPMKGLNDGPSKVEKSRRVQLKAKPPVLKSQVATKVVSPSEVDKKEGNDHEMVENVRGKPPTREDKPKVEEDQVIVDVQTPEAEEKAEPTADVDAKEASENPEGTLAANEELYGEDEEYGDDEYFEELTKEVMEPLAKEPKEEMVKLDNELNVGRPR
ncbi:hypothetical protein ACE6H2_016115 [Prunus campanulata]